MLRRTTFYAAQRTVQLYSSATAAPKVAKPVASKLAKPTVKTAPSHGAQAAAAQKPAMTAAHGAQGPEGDSIVDKVVLATALSGVIAWWVFVPGPHNQH